MNTIDLTIKQAPLFKGKVWKKQIEFTQSKFTDDTLKAVAFSKDGMQQLYVFEKRIYFNEIKGVMSNNEKSIPLNNVSSVECQSKGLFADIIITTSGALIKVEDVQVSIAQEVAKAIEGLKINA